MHISRHPLGFYEILQKPTTEELSDHYRNKYYGEAVRINQYSHPYTNEEILHKEIAPAEAQKIVSKKQGSLFEIGYGEGYFLQFFRDHGWEVSGVDFSDEALLSQHPNLRSEVEVGDVYEYLAHLKNANDLYDLVVCNNVLEHVVDPVRLAEQLQSIMRVDGLCRISVPNDGSWLQQLAVEKKYAEPDYWVCPPEHLNYFTAETLKQLLEHTGWQVVELLAEFPVDLFLLNPESNYQQDKDKGRNSHFAKIAFETRLYQRSLDELIEFRRGCASAGIGRNIVAYAKRNKE